MSTTSPVLPNEDHHSAKIVADPAARPFRRSFTAEYRARVIAEYDAAPHGQKAGVLRREGLYQSHIHKWTVARDKLAGEASAPRRRHRAAAGPDDPGWLRRENQRLTRELAKSQAVVDIMGKLHGLLEAISESTDTTSPSGR